MARSSEFVEFVLESLRPLGGVSARRMFGGFGIYKDGLANLKKKVEGG